MNTFKLTPDELWESDKQEEICSTILAFVFHEMRVAALKEKGFFFKVAGAQRQTRSKIKKTIWNVPLLWLSSVMLACMITDSVGTYDGCQSFCAKALKLLCSPAYHTLWLRPNWQTQFDRNK